ncbi:MAG: gamma-glutamylcyclotransferase [Pseudomonadota bacterium]
MALYVFGYGSLMWRPGFAYERRHSATIRGLHRRLCVYSVAHRGTPERPGLVMGLDRGGACRGVVFEVSEDKRDGVLAYLRERELITHVYLERTIAARLEDGRTVEAVTYVVDRHHRQYAGKLSHEDMLARVRGAVGKSGPNEDYVTATADLLASAGTPDPALSALAIALRG